MPVECVTKITPLSCCRQSIDVTSSLPTKKNDRLGIYHLVVNTKLVLPTKGHLNILPIVPLHFTASPHDMRKTLVLFTPSSFEPRIMSTMSLYIGCNIELGYEFILFSC